MAYRENPGRETLRSTKRSLHSTDELIDSINPAVRPPLPLIFSMMYIPTRTPFYASSFNMVHPSPVLETSDQYPGGLTRCDTLVHFGSSARSSASHNSSDLRLFARGHSLRMLFLYFFSFLSKIVYLSFGTISCSTGISSFHLSTAFVTIPCFDRALSTTATTESTARNRLRCRAFWNFESRHGIFLKTHSHQPNAPKAQLKR
jgi:hypothetical protein